MSLLKLTAFNNIRGVIKRYRHPQPEVRLFTIHKVVKCDRSGYLFLHVFIEKDGAKLLYHVRVHPNFYDDERYVWAKLQGVGESGLPRRLEIDHLSP